MKAFILAAGMGTRLLPYTEKIPKALVKIGEKSIIEYSLSSLRAENIDDITIINGYKHLAFDLKNVNYITNPHYDVTNMVSTLFCAKEFMNDDFIICYGDIIFEPAVLSKLIHANTHDISIIIDDDWRKLWDLRFENPLEEAETLMVDKKNNIIELGDKPGSYQQIQSQYIGLIKVSQKALKNWFALYEEVVNSAPNQIYFRGRKPSQIYMTDFLQLLINKGVSVGAVHINGGWIEVDSAKDYEIYNRLLKDDKLKNYVNLISH